MTTELIDQNVSFENDSDNALVIRKDQHIPKSFLDRLKEARDATEGSPMGDYHRVASIPVAVVEKWMKEGFNIWDKNVTAAEIVSRLKREHLDAFLTTTKRI